MSDKKLRIMINTNAMWSPSGYAQQARQFLPLIANEGYSTAVINFYGQSGGIFKLDNIYQYPVMGELYGDDAMIHHSKHFKPHVMFTLQDIWVLKDQTFRELAQMNVHWIPIVPIDHEPIPPSILNKLKMAYRIITYSPFGYEELKRNGLHSTYIPHTVMTDTFTKKDKSAIRKAKGIPDDLFMYGMVAANKDNPPRKGFQHALDAFAEVVRRYPKSGLYLHTHLQHPGGFPIEDYAKSLGIDKHLYKVDPYEHSFTISQNDMGDIYSMLDCYLCPSQNEGFGVPIIEAQSCEVPVIATNFTAMRDLVIDGKTGFKLNVLSKGYSPLQSYVAVPDTKRLIELMLKVQGMSKESRSEMGKNGREFVKGHFDLGTVWENNWKPFLNVLEKELTT